jgi:hypothetical protein
MAMKRVLSARDTCIYEEARYFEVHVTRKREAGKFLQYLGKHLPDYTVL